MAQEARIANRQGSWYGRYFVRHFSIYISLACVRLGISANAVTVAWGVAGLIGSFCMVPHRVSWNLVGFAFWQLWYMGDCVDGEVARLTEKPSLLGLYLDELNHVVVNSTFVLALGLHAYCLSRSVSTLVFTIAIYSLWHWKREIARVVNASLVVRGNLPRTSRVGRKSSAMSYFVRRVVLSFAEDVDAILIISAIILASHSIGAHIVTYGLYVYSVALTPYVMLLVVRDVRHVSRQDALRV